MSSSDLIYLKSYWSIAMAIQLEDRIMRFPEIRKIIGLSRSTIFRMEKARQFPVRIQLGKNSVGWRLSSVQKWIEARAEVKQIEQ
jgi:prophage regulatory protein